MTEKNTRSNTARRSNAVNKNQKASAKKSINAKAADTVDMDPQAGSVDQSSLQTRHGDVTYHFVTTNIYMCCCANAVDTSASKKSV